MVSSARQLQREMGASMQQRPATFDASNRDSYPEKGADRGDTRIPGTVCLPYYEEKVDRIYRGKELASIPAPAKL
jgi:hypothetical protein